MPVIKLEKTLTASIIEHIMDTSNPSHSLENLLDTPGIVAPDGVAIGADGPNTISISGPDKRKLKQYVQKLNVYFRVL